MSNLSWFLAFALIALLMIAVSLWMSWYSRSAMRSHKDQLEDIIREMRDVIDEERATDRD